MAYNNLWMYWAKKLHVVDENDQEWYGYCDDVTTVNDSMGDSIILETVNGLFEIARGSIKLIEAVA